MSYERRSAKNVVCPVCGYLACNFIPEKLGRGQIPAEWFEAMRRAVDSATVPELFDQRHHKEIL